MPEFEEVPEHIERAMTIVLSNMTNEAEKLSLDLASLIRRMKVSGMSAEAIEARLLQDLQEGGRIFGDFRRAFKANVRYGIEESGRGSVVEMFPDTRLWDWLGIADNVMCDTCRRNHFDVPKTYEEWQRVGLPGAGNTECQENCRCTLIPAGSMQKPENGIIRKKK